MEILTWFGRVDVQTGPCWDPCLAQKRDGMIKPQQEPASSFPLPQPDLRALAKACGFAADDGEYNRLLREAALGLVRRSILAGSTAEQDLLQAMEALDNLSQAINLLDERLYEWSRLHSQEIVHGKDLAEGLKEDENMGHAGKSHPGPAGVPQGHGNGRLRHSAGSGPQSLRPGRTRSWRQGSSPGRAASPVWRRCPPVECRSWARRSLSSSI